MLFPAHHFGKTRDMAGVLGIERSGTSLVGNLIATFSGAEYAFEPALLSYYEAREIEGNLDRSEMAGVLRTYFAQNVLMEGIHGRGYNLRPNDETCALNYKPYAEIVRRWTSIAGTADALGYCESHPELRVVFKVSSIYRIIPRLAEAFPALRLVEVRRDLASVAGSLLIKRWYHDDLIRNAPRSLTWPLAAEVEGVQIPYFVPQADFAFWAGASEASRAVYACIKAAEGSLALKRYLTDNGCLNRILDVPFEIFVDAPRPRLQRIADFLGMGFGEMTEAMLLRIDPARAKPPEVDLRGQCDRRLYDEFTEINKTYSRARHENWDI